MSEPTANNGASSSDSQQQPNDAAAMMIGAATLIRDQGQIPSTVINHHHHHEGGEDDQETCVSSITLPVPKDSMYPTVQDVIAEQQHEQDEPLIHWETPPLNTTCNAPSTVEQQGGVASHNNCHTGTSNNVPMAERDDETHHQSVVEDNDDENNQDQTLTEILTKRDKLEAVQHSYYQAEDDFSRKMEAALLLTTSGAYDTSSGHPDSCDNEGVNTTEAADLAARTAAFNHLDRKLAAGKGSDNIILVSEEEIPQEKLPDLVEPVEELVVVEDGSLLTTAKKKRDIAAGSDPMVVDLKNRNAAGRDATSEEDVLQGTEEPAVPETQLHANQTLPQPGPGAYGIDGPGPGRGPAIRSGNTTIHNNEGDTGIIAATTDTTTET
ncbi:expressed unknown protein [Seminavis robusta]|uniref:Uncharacterized protein n=1 Tax=Seminavis robusta TaxID=568900 RepID=A0A9N8HQ74_9STRA|nr:expressed unknown protein [Seminavis robusta]|eukprot:Sro1257_g256730.1 n/a (381) ;mRNA; f:14311-15547